MQKGLLGRVYKDSHEERDQTAPFRLKTARRGRLQKIQKFQSEIAIRKNLGFWNPNPVPPCSVSRKQKNSRVFAISTQFEAESRQAQNTKVVRKRSKINSEVESRRTVQ